MPAAAIEEQFDQIYTDLQRVAGDPRVIERLRPLGITAVIRVREADHLEAWCMFAGDYPEIRESGSSPDIEVVIPAALLENFWDRHLALEILEGRVTYTGKVRKLLQVMPVIRAAVRRNESGEVSA